MSDAQDEDDEAVHEEEPPDGLGGPLQGRAGRGGRWQHRERRISVGRRHLGEKTVSRIMKEGKKGYFAGFSRFEKNAATTVHAVVGEES